MSSTWIIILLVFFLVAPMIVSYVIEALRPTPATPEVLQWAAEIPIQYTEIDGVRLRYITVGEGPPLVLLHTLRTQLDIFKKVIPALSKRFTIYAVDYPGHGYSDIPKVEYTPELFAETVSGFLEKLDIKRATLAGISIGGTLPLIIAARHNPRVERVISINPYDYGEGAGLRRSSAIANVIFTLAAVPILGGTVMRFRNRTLERKILEGGVYRPQAIDNEFAEEMSSVGARSGHYRAFMNLLSHGPEWEKARDEYPNIQVPVLLVYGDDDWSTPEERERNRAIIRGAQMETVENGGHFLSLDRPRELEKLILEFASNG